MLAIIADDLTGALDAAAPFAGRGLHVEVALTVEAIAAAVREGPDVLSVDVGSREIGADAARHATSSALSALPPGTQLFKKVDSRLKGHIAAELDVTPFRLALMAPAIPEFGRVVRGGHVTGFGVEVPVPVAEKLGRHAPQAVIPDIATRQEMRAALDASEGAGIDLLIGARGLAEVLAVRMSGRDAAEPADIPAGAGLFVIGSRDPITLAQVERLRATCDLSYLPAPNGRLPGSERAQVDARGLTLVQAMPGEEEIASEEVAHLLAESICEGLARDAATLLLSGGATAEAVLKRMGIQRFRLLGECMPGLGLAHAGGHCIIAKSGGFGDPDTLKTIADRLLRKAG
jgi:uncharacterized protein YgbK (DUF1537 family)